MTAWSRAGASMPQRCWGSFRRIPCNMNSSTSRPTRVLLFNVYFIYFFCGMTQCFEGVILPEFKDFFKSTYLEQMLIPFAKNIPFVLAVGIGFLIARIGYKPCLSIALCFYA